MMDEFNKTELRRRMRAMSDEEQIEALKVFKSHLITEEAQRRLDRKEAELKDIENVFLKYRE